MASTDRRLGSSGSAAFKTPCVAATTANITLSGLQTIDGVVLVADDRVLVKNQTTASENGIYVADTSTWERSVDFDGPRDVVKGTLVLVAGGSVNGSTVFQLTTASPVIGTSSLTFAVTGTPALTYASAFIQTLLDDLTAAAARTTLGAVGLTGDETVAGIKGFTGANTHSGAETFTGNAIHSKLIVSGGASFMPQGRLTLVTAVPVMVSAQTAKTSVLYTPYSGNLIPLSDGTNIYAGVFAELSNDLTASSTGKAGPAAATTNSNYDLFVWDDSGTKRLTRGPLWTSDTGRGTGAGTSELQRFLGIWTNKVAITNGPGANLGTYVGTIRTDGSSQTNWVPGTLAAGGTAALLNVWNAYNRVDIRGIVGDTTDSWTYSTATVRSARAQDTMRVSFVTGLQEDWFEASYQASWANDSSSGGAAAGIGYDATNAFSGTIAYFTNVATGGAAAITGRGTQVVQPLGFHFAQACEYGTGTGAVTWYGDNGGSVIRSGLTYHGRF